MSDRTQETTDHPDEAASVRERAEGANSEQVTDEANLRADPSPPGEPPDAEEDDEPRPGDAHG